MSGFVGTFALYLVEYYFAQTQVMWCHLDIFIFFYIFESFFKAENYRRYYAGFVVGTGCSHVGQFLGFCDIDHDVVIFGVFAYHLSGIYLFLRKDKEASSVLKLVDGIGVCGTGFHSNE